MVRLANYEASIFYGQRCSLQADLNVTVALILLIASALLGFATGFFFKVWALAPISLLIAILSAICLKARGYGFAEGVSITIGCLVISQVTYIATGLVLFRSSRVESLMQEIDGDPDGRSKHDVRGKDE
jgi:hypothetical protein